MTKAKIVVAAKVGHRVLVVQVAVAARAPVATPQPHAAFTKPAPPRHAAHRATRRAKKPFVPAVQQKRALPARAPAPSGPFHHARHAKAQARVNARLHQEASGQPGTARTASGPQATGLTQPVRRSKAQARDHLGIGRIAVVPMGIVQETAVQETVAQLLIAPIATGAANRPALKASRAWLPCRKKTPVSASRK